MGLRCLLGHEYTNREVEREREERGDEVVVTYRTVETCDRCGERRIVSENKEVRPVRDPTQDGPGVTTGLGGDGSVTPDLGADETTETGADGTAETEPRSDVTPTPDATPAAPVDDAPADDAPADDAPADAPVDDAVILDDERADDDRHGGERPDPDDDVADDTDTDTDAESSGIPEAGDDGATVVDGEGWPDPAGEDEGFDAVPGEGIPDDAALDEEVGPEATGAAANGTTGASGGAAGKQFVAAQEVDPVGDDRSPDHTEFFCPNCGHARRAGGSSMRAGDICPECHQGYIAERER
jgi:hypothetical protein